MSQSLAAIYVHLVFSTKLRTPFLLDKDLRQKVHMNLRAVAHQLKCPALIVGGVEDHVHLLLRMGRDVSIATCAKEIKRVSSISAKELSPSLRGFSWQGGYGGFSVGYREIDMVRRYIETQEEHHKTESFKEEFLRLLREHDIEWDERYIWD